MHVLKHPCCDVLSSLNNIESRNQARIAFGVDVEQFIGILTTIEDIHLKCNVHDFHHIVICYMISHH